MEQKFRFSFNSKIINLSIALIALSISIGLSKLPVDLFLVRRIRDFTSLVGIFFLSIFISTILRIDLRAISRIFFDVSYKKFILTIVLLMFLLTCFISLFILDAIPHVQDEIVYLFQAKVFAIGKLYVKPHKLKEFFDFEFIINDDGKWYGKYFFCYPLLLSICVVFFFTWIINPILGAISVL